MKSCTLMTYSPYFSSIQLTQFSIDEMDTWMMSSLLSQTLPIKEVNVWFAGIIFKFQHTLERCSWNRILIFWGGNINLIINLMYSNSVHESAREIKPIKTPMARSTFAFCSQLQSHSQSQRIENRIDSSFKHACMLSTVAFTRYSSSTNRKWYIYIYI